MDERNADTRILVEKINRLKAKIKELGMIHQLDMAEIARLRRMVEAIADEKES